MRIRILAGLLSSVIGLLASAQAQTYRSRIEHPIVRYNMSARLDPVAKKVTGQYTLTWWKHTADTIPDLYFHLYLNAFKNLDSTFMREGSVSRRGGREGWFARPDADKWGWVDVDKIQIVGGDRKSTRLNSSHGYISYAVFCLKKKKTIKSDQT